MHLLSEYDSIFFVDRVQLCIGRRTSLWEGFSTLEKFIGLQYLFRVFRGTNIHSGKTEFLFVGAVFDHDVTLTNPLSLFCVEAR